MENNNRQGCRWVKCSDRLPDKEGIYTVKRHFSEQPEKAEYTGSIFTNYQGYIVKEWLDESESIEPCATSSSTDRAEKLPDNLIEIANDVWVKLPYGVRDAMKQSHWMIGFCEGYKTRNNRPSPTGDRDCEELKKEVERLKGLLEKGIHANPTSLKKLISLLNSEQNPERSVATDAK
jgi:hypothetical protein